jgi:alpha-L-fucosidase
VPSRTASRPLRPKLFGLRRLGHGSRIAILADDRETELSTRTIAFLAGLLLLPAAAGRLEAQAGADRPETRMSWWRQARFGLMMHWGLYSLPGNEWHGMEKAMDLWAEWVMYRAQIPVAEYEPLARRFNPVRYNAAEWTKLAAAAGMRYMVITAKHCDGFAMFRSRASKYNIVDATPFARDPMAELASACNRQGLKLGFYYSHVWDWHEPDALGKDNYWDFPDRSRKDPVRYYRDKALPQVAEIVNQYRPAVMWFDVPSQITRQQSQDFVDVVRKTVPDCIINNRVGNGLGDYGTPEQFIPGKPPAQDFEVCMTLNEHWGYDRNDHRWKEAPEVIRQLVRVVSMGGNYMLNVGPMADGRFPADAVRILNRVGQWMKTNGESIHGTTALPLGKLAWGYCTAKPGKLFLHVFEWPRDGQLLVPGVRNAVRSAWLLGDSKRKKLEVKRASREDLKLALPAAPADPIDSVIVLEIDGAPDIDSTQTLVSQPGCTNVFGAASAAIHGKDARYQGQSLISRRYDIIARWSDPQTWAGFRLRVADPGAFKVLVTYNTGADSAGNEFQVTIGPHTLSERVQSGLDVFETFTLGTVRLEPGAYEMAIRPKTLRKGSRMPDIHSVTLVPAPR